MKHSGLILSFLLTVFLPTAGLLHAQNKTAQTGSPDSTNYVVRQVNFKGNDHVSDGTLASLVHTHTNRDFLGIPGFTLFYYIYKLTGSFGEKPELLNYAIVGSDLERITRYYHSIGYLSATADSSITIKNKKAKVIFKINEGERSYIRSVAYSGVPEAAFQTHEDKINFYKDSKLTGQQINDSTFEARLPYSVNMLGTERDRIITKLKNTGFAAVKRDSVSALIKRRRDDSHLLDVLYLVRPGKRYKFGDVSIKLAGPHADTLYNYQQKDTVSDRPYSLGNKKIYLKKEESAQTHFSLLTEQLLFKPGDTYDYHRYIKTVNEFQNLGFLSIRNFGIASPDSIAYDSSTTLPVHFSLQTLPRHSLDFNLYGMRRYGFGSGAGVTFTNNNLFGRGESLQLGVNGSFEYVTKNQLKNVPNVGSSVFKSKNRIFQSFGAHIDLTLPRLIFPFIALNKNLFFANSSTSYSLNYNQSDQVLFDINAKLTFNQQFVVHHNKRFTSFLDLLQLELLDTTPTEAFSKAIEDELSDDPQALAQIREDFNPQFSSLIRYTFRSQNTDLIERDYGYYSEYSLGLGGTIPYLLDRFAVTPGRLEGELPSPVKVSANILDYSQYLKATADYRRYFSLSGNTVFATRGFGGYAYPFGVNQTVPIDQRFYAGGSNDIRGWAPFGLGPGGLALNQVAINGGEIKLLSQVELRQTVLKNFLSSNWILGFFTDAGNVWYGPHTNIPKEQRNGNIGNNNTNNINFELGKFKFDQFYKQIAVGSGVGLRLDFKYIIARFDFSFRIHDLQKGWLNNPTLFFQFGIGQSF